MPFGDRTGPLGLGPMTGRAAGYCAGYGVPGYMNPIPGYMGFGRAWAYPYSWAAAPAFGARWWPRWGWMLGGLGLGWGRGRGRRWAPLAGMPWFTPYHW